MIKNRETILPLVGDKGDLIFTWMGGEVIQQKGGLAILW